MGFKCGIVGLPNVGKSTLFNALTESDKAEAANYPFATIEPNIGRVSVPDRRLQILSNIGESEKTIPAYIDFVDIAGLVKGASTGEGLGNKFLAHIREVDAIAHVVRCFENDNVTHVSPSIDPLGDIDTIEAELKLADLEILQNKLNSLEKKSKSGDEKIKEQINTIQKIQNQLNKDEKIDNLQLKIEEKNFFNSLNLITSKPMLYICNVDEKSVAKGNSFSNSVKERTDKESDDVVLVSAEIESQIAELENETDKFEMLKELELKETTLNKVIHAGYDLLNLVTFFTCEPKETRAWTIKKNATASQAAGKIHTDFEKGFIRAETITYEDFANLKGEAACREAGKLRLEGKDYVVKDGDVFHFLFNV
jgi:GTP-binding protein YchF